jgi:hypothetical protein
VTIRKPNGQLVIGRREEPFTRDLVEVVRGSRYQTCNSLAWEADQVMARRKNHPATTIDERDEPGDKHDTQTFLGVLPMLNLGVIAFAGTSQTGGSNRMAIKAVAGPEALDLNDW